MADISEEEWKKDLTSILEQLSKSDYRKMLEYLTIPQSQKNGSSRSREEMPRKIIQHYGLLQSISAIDDIMDQIPRRDSAVQDLLRPFVDKLRNGHEKESQRRKRKRGEDDDEVLTEQQKSCQPDTETSSQSWKKTICDLKSSRILEEHGSFGKVVQKSGLRTYETKDKEKKAFFYLAVADERDSIKIMVYGKDRYPEIKEGSSYLFRRLIKDEFAVKVTARSIVSQTKSVDVPEELEMEARKLIYPESSVYSIDDAKSSANKTEVSVVGTVTQIDPVEKIKVNHEQKKRKRQNFQLKDDTGSIRICMWGDVTERCKGLSVGDVVKVTNMKTNKYCENVSLNSTGFTTVHKVQSVGIQNATINIIGIRKATKKETHLDAEFGQQVHTFVVASRLLVKAFGVTLDGDFKDSLLDKMPLSADVVIHGNKINKVTAA